MEGRTFDFIFIPTYLVYFVNEPSQANAFSVRMGPDGSGSLARSFRYPLGDTRDEPTFRVMPPRVQSLETADDEDLSARSRPAGEDGQVLIVPVGRHRPGGPGESREQAGEDATPGAAGGLSRVGTRTPRQAYSPVSGILRPRPKAHGLTLRLKGSCRRLNSECRSRLKIRGRAARAWARAWPSSRHGQVVVEGLLLAPGLQQGAQDGVQLARRGSGWPRRSGRGAARRWAGGPGRPWGWPGPAPGPGRTPGP